MQQAPKLTDPVALDRHRNRARAIGGDGLFLHELAATEVQERLIGVNRTFTAPAIVTPFAEPWRAAFPAAQIVGEQSVLPLAAKSHDLIVHAMHLHWSDDPVGQLVQCRHALKEDGLLFCVFFGGQTLAELRAALAEAEVQVTGGLSPRVVPMAEIRDAGALLQRAGFALPVADSVQQKVSYASTQSLMRDLRAMGETNALQNRHRKFAPRTLFDRLDQIYTGHFADPQGRLPATFELIFLTGWAPGPDQQKPLRPGSATARLADALGATETRLSDATDKNEI